MTREREKKRERERATDRQETKEKKILYSEKCRINKIDTFE